MKLFVTNWYWYYKISSKLISTALNFLVHTYITVLFWPFTDFAEGTRLPTADEDLPYAVHAHVYGNYWTTERTGVFESIQCGRAKLDHWERELTPTSAAASLLLSITSLLPGFMINKLSSSSCCLSTCACTAYGKSSLPPGTLVPSAKSVNGQNSTVI